MNRDSNIDRILIEEQNKEWKYKIFYQDGKKIKSEKHKTVFEAIEHAENFIYQKWN